MKKKKTSSTVLDLLRIADFILLNTLIFHEILSNQFTDVKSLRLIERNRQKTLADHWKRIEKRIDYKPIFKLANQVLNAYPTSPQTESVLARLQELALSIVSSGVHLRHDLMGRIYHKLLLQTMGGYYATYYTSVQAAVLISDLLIKTPNPEWVLSDLDAIERFRLIDPACGSGTLLSSTYSAIRDRFVLEHPAPTDQDLSRLHRLLLEKCMYGFDVLDYASHLTLTTLAMHNPRAKFLTSNIYTLPNGIDREGNIYLGSLDYLDPQISLKPKRWGPTESDEDDATFELPLQPGSFDCVVMNPPFSRSANPNLKFGYKPPEVRQRMGNRLKQLTRNLKMEGIGVAGLGAHFVVLGDRLLGGGGRIGIVIPRHILSGVSWLKVRRTLQSKYEIEYVISNFDPTVVEQLQGWCWSENTDLGEVLIIARKVSNKSERKCCMFVNVLNQPHNEVESLLLSQSIHSKRGQLQKTVVHKTWAELLQGGRLAAFAYFVEDKWLSKNWHMPCVFSHPEIVRLGLELSTDKKLIALGPCLTSKGRDIAIVKRNFHLSRAVTSYPMLYGHQSAMNTIELPDSHLKYGKPKEGTKSHEMHRQFASDLLIAERPHINSECLLAVEVSKPVLATAFWEVKLSNSSLRPLVLLWQNSTFGFILGLGIGANSRGPIFKIKQEHLDDILVPKPNSTLLDRSRNFYNDLKSKQFNPFPQEFELAAKGTGVRIEIDRFFAEELGLRVDLQNLYELLIKEPAMTLQQLQDISGNRKNNCTNQGSTSDLRLVEEDGR